MSDADSAPVTTEHVRDLVHLPLALVRPAKDNPRITIEKEPFHELKKSILQNGLLQPILVRPIDEAFEIIGGHRRFKAVSELAHELPSDKRFASIAAAVTEADDAKVGVLRLAENLNRKDLSPLEVAAGVSRAIATGTNKEALAESLGWSPRKLYKYLQLDAAPQWLKDFAAAVPVPKKRVDERGAPVLDAVTNAPLFDVVNHGGLDFTDVFELVTIYNVLSAKDELELKNGDPIFKPQAARVVRKLATSVAAEGWTTTRLRDEIKRLKEPNAAKKKGAKQQRAAFVITSDSAFIDFKRARDLARDERDRLASELTKQLVELGYTAVIIPDQGRG